MFFFILHHTGKTRLEFWNFGIFLIQNDFSLLIFIFFYVRKGVNQRMYMATCRCACQAHALYFILYFTGVNTKQLQLGG